MTIQKNADRRKKVNPFAQIDKKAGFCDLCGSESHLTFPKFMSNPERVIICRNCGLIATNPGWSESEIKVIYNEVFRDDPGAPLSAENDNSLEKRQKNYESAQQFIRQSLLPALCKFVDPAGKKWLDVRFRAGALPVELAKLGAEVHGVDIFDANVEWLKNKLPTANLYKGAVHDLLAPCGGLFDVISMVTTHVPAHVPSPTKLFQAAFEKLVSGGLLFVDEKDVTQISEKSSMFPFQYPYGMAHYYHLTLNTTRSLIEKAGFDILFAEYTERTSAQKHFLIVAQKTKDASSQQTELPEIEEDNSTKIYFRLMKSFLKIRYRQKRKALLRKIGAIYKHS